MEKKIIKLFDPVVGPEEESAVRKTLHSHFWSSGAGKGKVAKFEVEFRRYIRSNECVAVSSGSAALHLALSLLNIKNTEVILPSFTFVAAAHAVILNGAKPVFVDIDPNTLCINPSNIEEAISKKTSMILPVHFGGISANLDKINELCKKNKIILIEDAAHATGTIYNQKRIGSHGFAVCHSFNPTKNLVMPTGGAITLNGKEAIKHARILKSKRWCGIFNRKGTKYDVTGVGWNYFMNEFSAAIGLEQLKKIDKLISKRKKIAKRYATELKLPTKMPFDKNCSYHLFWIQVKKRHEFMKKMLRHGVETGIHFQPLHTMSFYHGKFKLPVTEQVGKHIVSLPMHPNLKEDDVSKIIKFTNNFCG